MYRRETATRFARLPAHMGSLHRTCGLTRPDRARPPTRGTTTMLTKEEVAKMSRPERLERLGRFGHELDSAISDSPQSGLCRPPDGKTWAPPRVGGPRP